MMLHRILMGLPASAILIAGTLLLPSRADALTTVPLKHVYNGHLLDSSGNPITTAVTIRFSFWTSEDFASGDVTGTGAINTAASTYAGWNEVHTVTPTSLGYFTVNLGSVTALPAINGQPINTLLNEFLQVEVKASAAANTSFELLDINSSSSTIDRSPVLSVPFAQNADFIDQREIGTSSGNIVILGSGAVFPVSTIPGGTNANTFVIDSDNNAPSSVTLQFGTTLGETISFNPTNSWFNFSDDVNIQGDLTVTGTINSVTTASFAPLHVASGGGLTVSIQSGSYRINGNTVNYTGSSSVTLPSSSTSYLFFTATGFQMNTTGYPASHSYIPLAQVVTSVTGVTSVTDRRTMQSDDREQTVITAYHPEYQGSSYLADGSANVGTLEVAHDGSADRNYYLWETRNTSLQDYDVVLRVPLSTDFIRFPRNPLRVTYRSSGSLAADNRLDITVFDSAGAAVTLSGSTTSLVNTSWTTTPIAFTGSPTFTPGGEFLIHYKLSARNTFEMHLGETKLHTVQMLKE